MTQQPTTPPLTWLRAFEAAARLGSLKDAAEELSVTPSTISHHVRDLEARLGAPLFTKQGRGVALTAEGEQYFRTLRHAFELLRGTVLEPADQGRRLRIGCFPFLANEVIVPRLDELKRALSGTAITLRNEVHLDSLLDPQPANRLDVLIRYGDGDFPGYLSLELAPVDLVPITAPGAYRVERAEDVLRLPIIHVVGPFDGWKAWADGHGLAGRPTHVVLETDSYHAAALAVEQGAGICLGILPFMRPWFAARRVQMLGGLTTRIDERAYLVYGLHNEHNRDIPGLHEWLKAALEEPLT
jgi:LysR family transcriptional regulator, glycine cleavage system transcriptional activator